MPSIFSRIIAGEIPSYKVAEDENNYAFLDINPLRPGHVLVVPKHETDYIFDLTDEEYASLTLFAKRVAEAVKCAVTCKRVGVAVLGMEVPHAHIHLVPLNAESDLNFFGEHAKMEAEEMQRIADAIASHMTENHPELF